MKLLSLNVEGILHTDRILPYLQSQNADVVCLQEGSETYVDFLKDQDYAVAFLPRCLKTQNGTAYTDGVILATRHKVVFTHHYYYKTDGELVLEQHKMETEPRRNWQVLVMGTIEIPNEGMYTIGTTHFTWTPVGSYASPAQVTDMEQLL